MKFIWSGKDNKIQGTEVAEIGHFGLCIARIPLQQAAVFEELRILDSTKVTTKNSGLNIPNIQKTLSGQKQNHYSK
jgi:hypothetical protein